MFIVGSAVRTCLGDGEATFTALLRGASGIGPLRYFDAGRLNVKYGYHIPNDGAEVSFSASQWLAACVYEALAQSGVDPKHERVTALVGTGLRELRAVERSTTECLPLYVERLHFASAVRQIAPDMADVITLSNACSAGGHALALAHDLIEQGEADAVVVAATDAMTESMLAMIGRFAEAPTAQIRPFDRHRAGVLLGEGAAAVVLSAEVRSGHPLARVLSTALSCDAYHETVPSAEGIWRAMQEALARGQRHASDVDLVVAHATGTALNDATEASLIGRAFPARQGRPLVTAIKGAVGHTSGSAALHSVDVGIRCLTTGLVPPIVGLSCPLDEGQALNLVIGKPSRASMQLACVNAFGFGGVNAVTLLEKAA